MSARPRPVTATIKPASMAPATGVRTRSYSLSSGSSTASLVSVLDHDSYESLPESEGEDQDMENKQVAQTQPEQMQHSAKNKRPDSSQTNGLSPWEDWLLQKAKEARKASEAEARRQRRQQREEEKKQREKEETQRKADEKYQEWLEKTTTKLKIQEKEDKRRSRTKEEIERAKQDEVTEKSKQRIEEWQRQKKKEEAGRKKAEKEKKRKEEEEREEKRKKCEEAFQSWCEKAKTRPKSAYSSFGYAGGKLTGYYDKTAHPTPSFYNPIPWQPIHVPQPKTNKKKQRPKSAATKRRWNPNKYL